MRHKDLGIWQSWTWAQMLDEIRAFSIGLAELGLKRGDKFTIVGNNRPRLYWAMCAGQALGAVPVPVYADAVADEMAYVLAHAEVTLAVVQDQEQVDKIIAVSDRVPHLRPGHLRRAARAEGLRPRRLDRIRRTCKASAARSSRAIRLALRQWDAGVAAGQGQRSQRHPLHLRNDRPFQGRDAHL